MKTRKFSMPKTVMALAFLFVSQAGISQEKPSTHFSSVEARGSLKILVSHADEPSFSVLGSNFDQSKLTTTVENGVLVIDYSPRRMRAERIDVRVSAPVFESLKGSGACVFVSEGVIIGEKLNLEVQGASLLDLNVELKQLTAKISGASRSDLRGKANELEIEVSGASAVHGFQLETENAKVNISGASSTRLSVSNNISGQVGGSSSLRLSERPASQNVTISGSSSVRMGGTVFRGSYWWDSPFTRSYQRKGFHPTWSGLEFGLNGFWAKDGGLNLPAEHNYLSLQYEKSFAVNLNLFTQKIISSGKNFGIYTGLGFGWNNYRFDNNELLVKGDDGIESTPAIIDNLKKNQLNVTFVNVPLMMEYQSRARNYHNRFNVSAGLNLGVRIRSNTVQKYSSENVTGKWKTTSDFYLNPFRLDLQARIGWGWMNVFGSYSLNNMFRDGMGPELRPFSFGIRLITGGY